MLGVGTVFLGYIAGCVHSVCGLYCWVCAQCLWAILLSLGTVFVGYIVHVSGIFIVSILNALKTRSASKFGTKAIRSMFTRCLRHPVMESIILMPVL